jgi:hypothetical protein
MGLQNSPKQERRKDKFVSQHCQPGLDDRCRDQNGQIREKNGNTRIDTLRKTYGDDFASGLRGDAHLQTLLDRTGAATLSDYLKNR